MVKKKDISVGVYMLPSNTIFIALPATLSLGESIAKKLGCQLITPHIIQFSDGEIEMQLPDPTIFKGRPVCIVQSTHPPVHETLMQMLLLAHELRNAQAGTITALIPYFGYARHDVSRISGGQASIILISQLLQVAGINNVVTIEIHNPLLISSLFLPVHSIDMASFIATHIKHMFPSSLDKICLVAPDKGGQPRVQEIARMLGVGHIFFTKERYATNKTKLISEQSHCTGSIAIVIDDIIDTGGTAIQVCQALHEQGYTAIYGYFIHPVLSGDALERIAASNFTKVFVSNTIPLPKSIPKIKIFDIAHVISEVLSM